MGFLVVQLLCKPNLKLFYLVKKSKKNNNIAALLLSFLGVYGTSLGKVGKASKSLFSHSFTVSMGMQLRLSLRDELKGLAVYKIL